MQRQRIYRFIQLSVASMLAGVCTNVFASGFQLFEQNGAGTGDFYAGAAAIANDASTAYFNPAGLVLIPNQQVVLSAVNIFSNVDFQGSSTWSNPAATAGIKQATGITLPATYTQTGSAQGGGYNLVPSFAYAAPINNTVAFGLSVGVPFGLETNYSDNSFVNYAATETAVQVIDISPSSGFKITNQFSVGAGLDAEHLDATVNAIAGLPTLAQLQGLSSNTYDTESENSASGWGYGWHAGMLYQLSPQTRVGLAYHSKVSFTVTGTSHFEGPLASGPSLLTSGVVSNAEYTNNGLSADATLPASTMFSVFHQINTAWAVMASAAYTEWSVFNSLNLENVAAVNAALGPEAITVIVPQGFQNTWRFAVGGSYQPCDPWLFRAGIGYDQTPTVSQYRNVRLPDGNRIAAALGAHYQATKTVGVDVGWTHIFFQDSNVNNTQVLGSQQTLVIGKAKTSADLIGAQLTWNIV